LSEFLRSRWALPAILAAAFLLRLVFAVGISGNDDMSVAAAAMKVLDHGLHVPVGHYEARLGLVLPLAGLFALGGVNVGMLLIVPMAASLLGISLACWIGTIVFDRATGLLAACVLAIYPMDVEYAGLYFPDLIQGALMGAAILLLLRRGAGWGHAFAAGLVWGLAYYVKEDTVFLGAVLLLGAVLRYIAWPRMILAGAVALGFVGLEVLVYGIAAGQPFLHANLVRRANDEVLAANMDYRDIWTYPKAMFLAPHETGAMFFVAVAGLVLALRERSRAVLMIIGWCLVFYAWLSIGFDPFSLTFRLKPQLPRYLQDFSIPLAILVGWTALHLWRRLPQRLFGAAAGAFCCLALLCIVFNALNYQAPRATRRALAEAAAQSWFPLYTDVQSLSIAAFLLHDTPHASAVHAAQTHDFLTGSTSFATIGETPAFLLINEAFAARLRQRNLVKPIDPASFGFKATQAAMVGAGTPVGGRALLWAFDEAAKWTPAPLATRSSALVTDAEDPAMVRIYRLDR
jgi:hypothetical protein